MKIVLPVLLGVFAMTQFAFGQTIYSTSFDSFTSGNIAGQDGWIIPSGYGSATDFIIQGTTTHSGTQALNITNDVGGGSAGSVRLRYVLPSSLTPGSSIMQGSNNFWVDGYFIAPNATDNANSGFGVQLTTGAGTASYVFRTNNTISNGTGATFLSGAWTRLTLNVVQLDMGNGTFDEYVQIYLNGTLLSFATGIYNSDATKLIVVASGNSLIGKTAAQVGISQIGVGATASANTGSGGYLDDFAISLNNPLLVPEPNTLALMTVGGLVAWATRRRKSQIA